MTKREGFIIILMAALIYTGYKESVFAFRNPCLTRTQLTMHFFDAVAGDTTDYCGTGNDR